MSPKHVLTHQVDLPCTQREPTASLSWIQQHSDHKLTFSLSTEAFRPVLFRLFCSFAIGDFRTTG